MKKLIIKVLIILFISFFSFIALGILYKELTHKSHKVWKNNTSEYELKGIINDCKSMHAGNGIAGYYIGLSNDSIHMFRIVEKEILFWKLNEEIGPITNNVLKKGDSVYKEKGSKKIKVYNNNKKIIEFLIE